MACDCDHDWGEQERIMYYGGRRRADSKAVLMRECDECECIQIKHLGVWRIIKECC
jgi:hypothetical protein